MTKKVFKSELNFEKLQKYIFASRVKLRDIKSSDCICFTKLCGTGGIFGKNPFNFGTKLNVLNNFLLRVEREVQLLLTALRHIIVLVEQMIL